MYAWKGNEWGENWQVVMDQIIESCFGNTSGFQTKSNQTPWDRVGGIKQESNNVKFVFVKGFSMTAK